MVHVEGDRCKARWVLWETRCASSLLSLPLLALSCVYWSSLSLAPHVQGNDLGCTLVDLACLVRLPRRSPYTYTTLMHTRPLTHPHATVAASPLAHHAQPAMCDSSSTTNASSSSSIVVSMDEEEDYLSDSDCSYDSRREKEMDAANMLSSLRNVSGADRVLAAPVSSLP